MYGFETGIEVKENFEKNPYSTAQEPKSCLLISSDADDELLCVDLGRRLIIDKKMFHRKPFLFNI